MDRISARFGRALSAEGYSATSLLAGCCVPVMNHPVEIQLNRISHTHWSPLKNHGPTPPLWQSEQVALFRSPMSTGCWKAVPVTDVVVADKPSSWPSRVWQTLQSFVTTLPSLLTWFSSWQRKHPG